MDLSSNFRMLALYNQRMNQQLLGICEQLSPQQLNQETHSFFPSVMAHWNHILFGDLIMLQRLVTNQIHRLTPQQVDALPIAKAVDDTFVTNIEELKALRSLVDQIYIDMTKDFTAETCGQTVFISPPKGEKCGAMSVSFASISSTTKLTIAVNLPQYWHNLAVTSAVPTYLSSCQKAPVH